MSDADHAYAERDRLVRFLASLRPSGTARTDIPGWAPGPFAVQVPGGVLEIHGRDFCSTRYPGLPPVDACPHDTDAYRAQAQALGYGDDIATMSKDHEAAHHLLARLFRLPCSPTMYGIALHAARRGPYWPAWRKEEAAVLTLQAYARAAGVSLIELVAA